MPLHRDDPKSVGGYKLVDRLGAGGMGVVYRGRARSGREVAVKVVHAQYAADAVFRTRFRQEIEAVRKVSGAFTAAVVDADPEAERPWMATQYVPGRSLAQVIRDRGPLRDTELRGLALGLVEALRDIHRAGVVHRDLKPANVLMAGDGPRVIDFGISRAAENLTLTETGQMIGTPPFMSPEQLTDARTAGPASDVFSLGTLLVYALTGRGPFDADSPYLTAYRVVHDEPVLDGVDPPLRTILERCLAKEAADRPGLDELAGEFAAVLPEGDDGLWTVTTRADPSATPQSRSGTAPDARATPRAGRRLRPLLAATGTVGALVLGLTAYLLPGGSDSGDKAGPAPSATSRWAAPPAGWQPWRTTVFETASSGVRDALPEKEGDVGGDPVCRAYEGDVYCAGDGALPVRMDGRTGRTLWRAGLAPSDTERRLYYSAVLGVRDGTVLVAQSISTDAPVNSPLHLVALDARTGDRLWTREVGRDDLPLEVSGDLVLATEPDGRTVTARAPRTGTAHWSLEIPAGHHCRFATGEMDLYAMCLPVSRDAKAANRTAQLLVVDPADGSARRLKAPLDSEVLGVTGGRVAVLVEGENEPGPYSDTTYATLLLVDPATGARSTTKPAEAYRGEPTLADGMLWFTESDGRVTAVSPRTGKRLWRTPTSLEKPGHTVYDARTGVLYLVSDSGRVAALDGRKGTPLWETLPRTAGRPLGSMNEPPGVLLQEGTVVVAAPDGTVFSLAPAHPERKPVSG